MLTYRHTAFLTSVALAVGSVGILALPGWGQARKFHYLNGV